MTEGQRDRMLAGELYMADDPVLVDERNRARALTKQYNDSPADDQPERWRILGELLGAIGEDTYLEPPFYCDYGYQIRIGARSFANFGLVALDVARIDIGDDVLMGPYVQLLTATHPVDPRERLTKWETAKPISIGDNVWLGGGAIVCPGVSIGNDTVVGAGAVVTKDLPSGVVALGNPARVIREL